MAHANVIGNRLIVDSESSLEYRRFGSRISSKFKIQIDKLEEHFSEVPPGWLHLFRDAVRMLRAVDCPQRNGIELSVPYIQLGELRLRVYFAPTDKVVRAIVRKLIAKTTCTCSICGSGIGAIHRNDSDQVLCASCHVRIDLHSELRRWIETRPDRNLYKSQPIIEFKALPLNIQLLIPRQKIKTLHLKDVKPIKYITHADVKEEIGKLTVMLRFLDQDKVH